MFNRKGPIGAVLLALLVGLTGVSGMGGKQLKAEAGVLALGSNTYGTGLVIVNQSTAAVANITITVYSGGSQLSISGYPNGYTDAVSPARTKSYCSCSVDSSGNVTDNLFKLLPANTLLSFVISADQPIAATVNTQRVVAPPATVGTSDQPFRIGTSAGVAESQSSQTVYAPQVLKNFGGFTSRVYVQCAVSSDCNTTWTVYERNAGNIVATFSQSIRAFSSYEYDPASSQTSFLPDNMYSLKVTGGDANQKLTMATNFFNTGNDAASSQFQSYNGASAGDTLLYAPRVVRKYFSSNSSQFFNYNSGFRVQNIGSLPTTIRFTYTFNNQQYTNDITNVNPGQSVGPYLGDDKGPNDGGVAQPSFLPNDVTGSAIVQSISLNGNPAQPIIGIVNEDSRILGQGDTYNMFRASEATTRAVVPQVVNQLGNSQLDSLANGGGNFVSGVQFQNVGSSDTQCTVTFSGGVLNGDFVSTPMFTAAGASRSLFLPAARDSFGNSLPVNFNGAARVDCGSQKVVAIANLSVRQKTIPGTPNGVGDSFSIGRFLNQ